MLILYIFGLLLLLWVCASLAFTFLSLGQAIVGLPRRFVDWLRGLKERRERRRIQRARDKRWKTVIKQIEKGEL